MQGIIFDIKHYAIHDGPGIRQTVFLKGCPLSCWWCHNPESRRQAPFHYLKKEKMDGKIIERKETIGYTVSVEELLQEIKRDILFFEESGGGVTFSGGEPLMQHKFLFQVLQACKKQEIHTCVDTTGYVSPAVMMQAAQHTDLFLYDLKHMDEQQHLQYTGVSNRPILENLLRLDSENKEINIRFPLIPGINDDESNLFKMIAFLQKLKNRPQVSILPYHKIGSSKYRRFGIPYRMGGVEEPSADAVLQVKQLLSNAGFEVTIGG